MSAGAFVHNDGDGDERKVEITEAFLSEVGLRKMNKGRKNDQLLGSEIMLREQHEPRL
jgi:hypothetical protein